MAGKSSNEWARVATYVNARMKDMVIDQAEITRRSGLSGPLVRGIMRGAPRGEPRSVNLIRLSIALGWEPDSIDAILAGGEPELAEPSAGGVSPPDALAEMEARLRQEYQAGDAAVDARVRGFEARFEAQLASMVEQIEALADRLDQLDAGES